MGAPISLEFPLMLWINTSIQSSISCTDDIGYGLSEPVWVWVFFWDVALWKKIAHPTMATSSLDHDTYADVSKIWKILTHQLLQYTNDTQ